MRKVGPAWILRSSGGCEVRGQCIGLLPELLSIGLPQLLEVAKLPANSWKVLKMRNA
jgi:hypothetical protein